MIRTPIRQGILGSKGNDKRWELWGPEAQKARALQWVQYIIATPRDQAIEAGLSASLDFAEDTDHAFAFVPLEHTRPPL